MGKVVQSIGGLFGGSKTPKPAPPPVAPNVNQAANQADQDAVFQQQLLSQQQGYASTIKTSGQGAADEGKAQKKLLGA